MWDSPAVLGERSLDPFLGMSPHNDRAEEPWRVELPVLRRADTTECCDSMRRRIKQPDTATVPDWPNRAPLPRRWAKEPDRRAGIIGIKMPRRSIEHVGPPRRRSLLNCPHDGKEPVRMAPLAESAWCGKSDSAMRQKPPMPTAARCDLFFV